MVVESRAPTTVSGDLSGVAPSLPGMRWLALSLLVACGGLDRDAVLDGVGATCAASRDCPPAEVCLAFAERPPARCWGARVNGQACPAGGAEIAWGLIPGDSWYACTLRCYSDADCLHGLRCHSPDQVCLP